MAITLYYLFEASLLILNSITVLHEERFLSKMGWGRNQMLTGDVSFSQNQHGIKANILNLIHSTRTIMRIPLIFINILVIIFKMVAG